MSARRAVFLKLSSVVAGYSEYELEGTGLIETYQRLIEDVLGPKLILECFARFESAVSIDDIDKQEQAIRESLLAHPIFGPVVLGLVSLWYLGSWTQLADSWYAATGLGLPTASDAGRTHTPSQLAYIEQFSYRTASAHTPGAKPTGFGSWSYDPS
jgi:hypothetical protein